MTIPLLKSYMIGARRVHVELGGALSMEVKKLSDCGNRAAIYDLRLINNDDDEICVDSVEISFPGSSFYNGGGQSYRFFKEGLSVIGTPGARGYGDCDFELDPDYLKFTVSNPPEYRWDRPNNFSAEQVAVIAKDNGEALLLGFITAKKYFTRIDMSWNDCDEIELNIVIDLENAKLAPGESLELETLMIGEGTDQEDLLQNYASEFGKAMGALTGLDLPTGWCSYYHYGGRETESDILENAEFLARHRETIPVEYIQIDDGWQATNGNWLEIKEEKFPHGMEWLASKINDLGFKAGIWVAPFLVTEKAPIHTEHEDWLIRDVNGEFLSHGPFHFLDPSHPEALTWLAHSFKVMKSWGYSYFKLDFMMMATCYGAKYFDESVTRIEAYRKGLAAIREAVGPDAVLLGCTSLIGPNVGLVDACRISTDIIPFWCTKNYTAESPTVFNVCRNLINRGYMHKKYWVSDPDCLIVRKEHNRTSYKDIPALSLEESRTLASAMLLSGGSMILGDRLSELPAERIEIIEKVFSMLDGEAAIPLDRMECEIPRLWYKKGEGSKENPHLLGVFNWDSESISVDVPMSRLGLDSSEKYNCEDVWVEERKLECDNGLSMTLAAHECRLLALWR